MSVQNDTTRSARISGFFDLSSSDYFCCCPMKCINRHRDTSFSRRKQNNTRYLLIPPDIALIFLLANRVSVLLQLSYIWTMTLAVFFLTVLVAVIIVRHLIESRKFPPGYPRLPLFGSAFSFIGTIGSAGLIQAAKDATKYNDGKFMGIFLGTMKRAIFVFDFEIAKEIAFSDKYAGKFEDYLTKDLRGHRGRTTGIITTQGQAWKTNRRFSLSTLRGKNPILEKHSIFEAQRFFCFRVWFWESYHECNHWRGG